MDFALANISRACELLALINSHMKLTLPRTVAGLVAFAFCSASSLIAQSKPEAAASSPSPEPDAKPSPAKSSLVLPDPVATVNGQKISKADLEKAFGQAANSAGVKPEDLSDEQKLAGYRQILDDMILDKLVEEKSKAIQVSKADVDAELAKIKGQFENEEEFKQQLQRLGQTPEEFATNLESMLRQRKWLEGQVGDKGTATEADAKAFYESNAKEFENPDLVAASHILFMVPEDAPEDVVKQKEKAAKDAEARAKKGEDFNALAKELSEEPAAKQSGGDLGLFAKEDMVPEFAAVAFAQKVGDISDPVRTKFGFHVIKVTDKKAAGKIPFEEVKERVVVFLNRQKSSEAIKQALENLRNDAKVEVNLPGAPADKS